MADPTSTAKSKSICARLPASDTPTLDKTTTGLRVSVWTEANASGGWDLVMTCTNRDAADRRLSFATQRLAEEAVAPCSMKFMDDIKRAEGTDPAIPPLI